MQTNEKSIDAFLRIYADNKDTILQILMRYSNINYHVAQEITQEVFTKLYEHFDTYDEDYLFQWMLVTARNEALNYSKKAIREVPDEDIILTSDLHELGLPGADEEAIDNVEREEQIREGRYLMDELYQVNERWFEAMTMTYCDEMKQQDVAEKLGVSIEVLHSVLYRARKWVREKHKPDKDLS